MWVRIGILTGMVAGLDTANGFDTMLSARQAAAKEEAHRCLDYPTHIAAERHGDLQSRDKLPRYRHGITGIGIAGDILRIYILEDQTAELETPGEIAGLRTERVLFDRLSRPGRAPASATLPRAVRGLHRAWRNNHRHPWLPSRYTRRSLYPQQQSHPRRFQRRQPRRRHPPARRRRQFEFQYPHADRNAHRLRAVEVR